MNFEIYPFEKLAILLDGITSNQNYKLRNLTIGEPQFSTPQFIQNKLKSTTFFLNKYPKSAGEDYLKDAQINFFKRRFNIALEKNEIISTFGTREVLFNFPQFQLFDKQNPTMAFSNPFYQIYEGSAIASRAKIIYMDITKENNYLANLDTSQMKQCNLVILNYPNNPTGATINMHKLKTWVQKALEFDFVLINDECYSELYFDENHKPISLLEACKEIGNYNFKNCLVLNSISKRSSSPGLRSGFIAGDKNILKKYARYRTYVGCALPLPLQEASAVAWNDEAYTKEFRKIYKQNFQIAKEILDINIPLATFYVWLKVEDELNFTQELYHQKNIKVLPGSFLGRNGIGKGYVRLALVEDNDKTKDALIRLKDFINSY
jgi:aspartate/methionine/tyrosine aminotransferase